MPPIDRMDPESYPWPKRYPLLKWNLKRAFNSIAQPGAATNRATHLLFNSSSGDRVLVVRGLTWSGTTNASAAPFGVMQGSLGSHTGAEFPVWAGERVGAGQHWYVDTLTALPNQELVVPGTSGSLVFINSIPLAVLPPGWSCYLQGNAAALTILLSWYWEELRIDDPWLGAIVDPG